MDYLSTRQRKSSTRVYLEEVSACDKCGNELRRNEEWRNETQDVTNRINKANTAFWSFD